MQKDVSDQEQQNDTQTTEAGVNNNDNNNNNCKLTKQTDPTKSPGDDI